MTFFNKLNITVLLAITTLMLWVNVGMTQTEWEKYPDNPVLDLGEGGTWDDDMVAHPTSYFDGTKYHMWYGGYDSSRLRIGYATSDDGIVWKKHSDNPVLDVGENGTWDDDKVNTPSILFDGTKYQMWYSGKDGSRWRIGYATSIDGIVWEKHSDNPVLDVGGNGTWDDYHVSRQTVLFDGTHYQMWYTGFDGSHRRIGYATSMDGIVWEKHSANPVLDIGGSGTWDDDKVGGPTVLFDGTKYQMWYGGKGDSNWRIGYATSDDGIVWKKHSDNPVLDVAGNRTWDNYWVYDPSVLFDGTHYRMWYIGGDGSNYRIGYATSEVKHEVPALITDNLEGYWKFDGNTNDSTANGNDLTNNGASSTSSGKINEAYEFDGIDNDMTLSEFSDISSLTVAFWMYSHDDFGNTRRFELFHIGGLFYGIIVIRNDERLAFGQNFGFSLKNPNDNWHVLTPTFTPAKNTWYHVVCTWDAKNQVAKLYIDGKEEDSDSGFSLASGSQKMTIGDHIRGEGSSTNEQPFDGILDEIAIWRRALSAEEIKKLYNNGTGLELYPESSEERSFKLSLDSGINMISLPLKPEVEFTARSFAEKLSATTVIRYDTEQDKFTPFVPEVFSGDGFQIEGGQGYIVNLTEAKEIEFTGTAWSNAPLMVSEAPVKESPHWAFVVCGAIYDENRIEPNPNLTVIAENLSTGEVAEAKVGQLESGRYTVAFVNLGRKDVVEIGDSLRLNFRDTVEGVTSEPVIHTVEAFDIAKGYIKVNLRMEDLIPKETVLLQNYPNPFNPDTWIPFKLASPANVEIRIYNLAGQLVREINLGNRSAGIYLSKDRAAHWDGRNNEGEKVSSGVYFYTLEAGDYKATRRMMSLK